ncbi:MAG TPA: alkaline phosphatase family protein [Actinomycetota bacterium]|nr:alkaline phosphatase family protein [Actinomycetota bacterium]
MDLRRGTGAVALALLVACSTGGAATRPGASSPSTSLAPLPGNERETRWFKQACKLPATWLERVRRGDYPGRSPDVYLLSRPPNVMGGLETMTTHSGPWPYLQQVPLVFYGPGYIPSQGTIRPDREVTLADVAPTVAELLDFGWPTDRPGQPIEEALLPAEQRGAPPKLIVTVIWDGGGWNVLHRWPDEWPHLKSLMERGTLVGNAIVGSSPSVTPAIHATIGTGAFPRQHGIVDIWQRAGDRVAQSYEKNNPKNLELPTLADLYDRSVGNRSKVGVVAETPWHLGMMGHGAHIKGGDRDIAVLEEKDGTPITRPSDYTMPSYIPGLPGYDRVVRHVDLEDGRLDDIWMGHRLLDDPSLAIRTPVQTIFQTKQSETILRREGFGRDNVPDLFYTNYKPVDLVGHIYNMLYPEMKPTLRETDRMLGHLIRFLNGQVGKKKWVMVMSADHGQGPAPGPRDAWGVNIQSVMDYLSKKIGIKRSDLFQQQRPTGLWLDIPTLGRKRATAAASRISDLMVDYTIDDDASGSLPSGYENRGDERLFEAAFPRTALDDLITCAQTRASG